MNKEGKTIKKLDCP